jgi:hypothetical protein
MPQKLEERIVGLLDDPRVEMRCAAALVLGATGAGSAHSGTIGKALAKRLDDVAPVQRIALDALIELKARGLADKLAPLIGSSDEVVRGKALQLLAAQGAAAEQALGRELSRGTAASRAMVVSLLAKRAGGEALDALFDQLADPDVGEHTLHSLRQEIDAGDARQRAAIEKQALAAIQRLGARTSKRALPDGDPELLRLAALLRLVGYCADPATLAVLAKHAQTRQPLTVRLAAIAAMRRILARPDAKGTEPAIVALIEFADDADAKVARAAVDTLRGTVIPDKLIKKFSALARATNPDARRLAVERLPATGGAGAVEQLIENLTAEDAGPREAAARALAQAPEAAAPLARALARCDDPRAAWHLSRALQPHAGRVPDAAIEAVVKALRQRIDRHGDKDRVAAMQLETLHHLAPGAYAEVLFDEARRLRRGKHYTAAFAALRPLAQTAASLDDEQRFFIGVLGVKAAGKEMIRRARDADPVLGQFRALLGRGYPVATSLAKQKDIEPEELFSLGFSFLESREDEDRELGAELLEQVLARQPRGKLATACKNKLRLTGMR